MSRVDCDYFLFICKNYFLCKGFYIDLYEELTYSKLINDKYINIFYDNRKKNITLTITNKTGTICYEKEDFFCRNTQEIIDIETIFEIMLSDIGPI